MGLPRVHVQLVCNVPPFELPFGFTTTQDNSTTIIAPPPRGKTELMSCLPLSVRQVKNPRVLHAPQQSPNMRMRLDTTAVHNLAPLRQQYYCFVSLTLSVEWFVTR